MNKIYKSVLAMAAVAGVAGVSLTPALVNAWGDSANGRTTYTIKEINAGKLGNTITFNSITDGKIGDERNFVGARLTGGNSSVYNADSISVKDGETYTIRLYVHNNSPKGTNGVAKGVSANFSLPTTVAKEHTVIGYLNSSNATPTRYWDEVKLTSSDDFYMEYVPGSAKYTNTKGTFALSDNIISGNVNLGYTSMNGEVPGCYEYDGEVTIQVKIHNSVAAKLQKTVRMKGSGTQFGEVVNANVGDEVEFQIEYVNLLSDTVKDVMIRDILPNNLEYVQNSTYLYNASHQNGVQLKDNTVATSGINIGDYKTNGNAYVRFTAKVVDKSLACGSNQLVNWANSTVNSKVSKDDASVMVNKTGGTCNSNPTPNPNPNPNPTPNPDPTPTPTPKKDEGTPITTIVSTGPEMIVAGALGAGAVTTAAGYAIVSFKNRKNA